MSDHLSRSWGLALRRACWHIHNCCEYAKNVKNPNGRSFQWATIEDEYLAWRDRIFYGAVIAKRGADGLLYRIDPTMVNVQFVAKHEEALFGAFVGGFEAVYDDELDMAKVRKSYEEWQQR